MFNKYPLHYIAIPALYCMIAVSFTPQAHAQPTDGSYVFDSSLEKNRADFRTDIVNPRIYNEAPEKPDPKLFTLIKYPSAIGELSAYITPDPKDRKKHPAVIFVQGGFGGIGDVWSPAPRSNDQTGSAFRKAGLVLMVPSFRGENDNPGKDEFFYGDINDIQSARDYLAKQPYVDPNRIYLVGHSTGGTRTLLASEMTHGFRAYFSLGGVPYLKTWWDDKKSLPFNTKNDKEYILRSPGYFISSIKTPTFNFEGEKNYQMEFDTLQDNAHSKKIPFYSYKITSGNHFNIITPVTEMIAQKILKDTKKTSNIEFSPQDIQTIEQNIGK